MNIKIISSSGRVSINGLIIPPYPEIVHLTEMMEPLVAQEKVNGFNVRVIQVGKELILFLRGGLIDEKITKLFLDNYADRFSKFFADNPKKVICLEMIGKKTFANYKGDKDIDYFVFDIMDLEKDEGKRFLPWELVSQTCDGYGLNKVNFIGTFDSKDKLKEEMKKVDAKYEGVVLKTIDGNKIVKYKWEDEPELFADKIHERPNKSYIPSDEENIVSHFLQGYGEPELGLKTGITPEELGGYERNMDNVEMLLVDMSKISESVNKMVDYIMSILLRHGEFSDEMKLKLEKYFRGIIGNKIGKFIGRRKKGDDLE